MSTKTFFKRISLGLVAALGFGLLSAPTSQAARLSTSFTLSAATATATVGETATGSWTLTWGATATNDTTVVRYSCQAPAGVSSCPIVEAWQLPTADTAGISVQGFRVGTYVDLSAATAWGETLSFSSATGRSTVSYKAANFLKAGTYTYTFYVTGANGSSDVVSSITSAGGNSTTWTVTVAGIDTSAASIKSSYFAPTDAQAAYYRYGPSGDRKINASSTDSSIALAAGAATASDLAGVLYLVPANGAGETRVALGSGFAVVQDTVTAVITGGGTISSNGGTTKGASATLNISAYGYNDMQYSGESLTVYTNGTSGVATITISKGSATLLTKTITFTGKAASATVYLSDTVTSLGGSGVNLVGHAKDAAGNVLKGQTLYVFSSDTAVAGSIPTSTGATTYRTTHACTGSATTGLYSCAITLTDTGTATITLRDSWTVSASTFTSNEVTLDIRGNTVASVTVAFDKATYAPGEKAIISITAKDASGKAMATRADHTVFSQAISTPTLTATGVAGQSGTQGTAFDALEFLSLLDGGVETRVVTMPTYATDVTYELKYDTFGLVGGVQTLSSAKGTAKVVDPNAALIAASQAAAEAATDAANEAIDAANAATDAANLSAEAADAATVAAEEARDAADAATAAVEELATQVATLMAALKAQITTLANTVAKIAKKVKA